MITEDRVTFEIAKLLEEKGFKGEFKGYYDCNGFYFDTPNIVLKESGYAYYPIPSLSVVLKWLREVHNIDITITPDRKENYTAMIFVNKELPFTEIGSFKTYEVACEAAIKYILEHLI